MYHQDPRPDDCRSGTNADDLPLGAHLVTERHGYMHHGIYAGHGRVIHYAGFARALRAAPVEETTLEAFAAGHGVAVLPEPCAHFMGLQAVQRARSRLGEDRYHLLTNNCEHFCSWCLLGKSHSAQVEACLRHPRAMLQTAKQLLATFLGTGWTGTPVSLRGA